MKNLTDEKLLHAYETAKRIHLEKDFIRILEKEINDRGLNQKDQKVVLIKR